VNPDFEPPSKGLSILAHAGGVVTAVVAIATLQYWSTHVSKTTNQANATSVTQNSSPMPLVDSQAQNALDKEVEQKAAACKFDPKITPNRGITFELKTFYSKAMGQTRTYGLILPPGYDKHLQESYPVIFLLHGGHGDAAGWQACGAVTEVLYKLYSSGKLPPAVVITPDGNDKRGSSPYWDPQYFDGPNGEVATLIGSELVQEVQSRYRVLKDPKFWAMGGLSSGGWGAFNIGLRYLDRFNILFSHSGYFTDDSGSGNSPIKLVQKLSPKQRSSLRVYLDAGVGDKEFLDETAQFQQKLVDLGIVNAFNVFPGGHGTTSRNTGSHYWHKHLEDSLSYVGVQWKSTPAQKDSTF
jgi:enterochelin esterase-like enzyme